ncbi:hypothetical protein BGZ51_007034 [Haplosporangium sp. Z 767]|nr:hypothetical protein BGZ51_007034 [Haplosporangium sp. Z 767]
MPFPPVPQKQDAETSMQSSTTSDSEQSITPRKRRLYTDTALAPTAEPMKLIQDRESFLKSLEALDIMMEQENRGQVPTALLAGPRTDVHSFGKKLRVQLPANSIVTHIPGSKTTAAGVRAATDARAVARNTTAAMATGIVVEVATPSPSPAPVSSSSSAPNSLDAIEPWTVPLTKKTVRFTLPPEIITEDTDTSDNEEAPEPEQYNNTVDVVPSSVDSTPLSVTESRELTPFLDSPSAKRYSLASPPDSPPPINLSVVVNPSATRSVPRGSIKEMRPRSSAAEESSRRFTPLGFRPPMLRRSSAVNSFDLSEDTMDEVVETDMNKVSDDFQTARKTEQKQETTDRLQKHALAVNETRDSKRAAKRVGISPVQDEDTMIVVDDVKEVPVPLDSSSAEVAADSSHPARIALASSSNVDVSPPVSPSKTASKKCKKEKATFTSVATMIGSRRKQPVPTKALATTSSSSTSSSSSSPTKATAAGVISHKRMLPSRRPGPVIELTDDEDEIQVVNHNPVPATKELMALPFTVAEKGPEVPEVPEVLLRQKSPSSKPATTRVTPKIAEPGPLSGLRVYVIPTGMDSTVFRISRERVVQLSGKWLGPKTKILSTDPRAVQEVPELDQTITTHIVTALSSIEAVKRFFGIEEIDFKKPMDPENYSIHRRPMIIPVRKEDSLESTPPSSQGLAQQALASRSTTDATRTEMAGDHKDINSTDMNDGSQSEFEMIVKGFNEGSLHVDEMSDMEDCNDDESSRPEDGETGENEIVYMEGQVQENQSHQTDPDLKARLKREGRCFRCQKEGHWMENCSDKDKDDVLLQIISSGKSEGKRRAKILYQCQSPHVAGQKEEPLYNKKILEQLTTLMNHYDKIKTKGSKEHFKVINYRKAITSIRALDYEIKSKEMALKVDRIGKKMAEKIGECIAFGKIRKLDHLNVDKERSRVETLFRNIYGVGSEKASDWYNLGLRTLDDVRKQPDLTKNQIVGLQYYDDLLVRIPRAEVEQIGKVVEDVAKKLHPDIQSQVTGSFRRGKSDCGDIDIVVARPNIDDGGHLYQIMHHILKDLINEGFLVEHLSLPTYTEDMANKLKHFKYMGICKLPGEKQVHHHIDILVVPWMHLGSTLLYFTGNDICNRSMRQLASNRGMRLSDKGLFINVIRDRNRKRVNEGQWVAGRTEREVFEYLGIKYLEPHEREC